jgi:hypothetical protein
MKKPFAYNSDCVITWERLWMEIKRDKAFYIYASVDGLSQITWPKGCKICTLTLWCKSNIKNFEELEDNRDKFYTERKRTRRGKVKVFRIKEDFQYIPFCLSTLRNLISLLNKYPDSYRPFKKKFSSFQISSESDWESLYRWTQDQTALMEIFKLVNENPRIVPQLIRFLGKGINE